MTISKSHPCKFPDGIVLPSDKSFYSLKLFSMVQIVDYRKRTNSEGEEFFALILQVDLEMVKSQDTGNYYATRRAASVASTFDENTCKSLIGQKIPGSVQRIPSEPYEFIVKETGGVLILEHRWTYLKEGDTVEEVVFEGKPETVEALYRQERIIPPIIYHSK